jgi:type IV pilus assembly protein PilF
VRIFGLALFVLWLSGCASDGAGLPPDRAFASAKIHTELAESYFERKQYSIALQEIEIALRSKSNYAPAFNVRGLIHLTLREDILAEEDFRHGLKLDESDSTTHNNYGWFLCQRGRENEAILQFLEALKNPLYSTPEMAFVNAGVCSQKINKLAEAEEYFQRALVRTPNLPDALFGLAEVNFIKHDVATAKSYFLRLSQRVSELTAPQLWLAIRIERKVGDRNSEQSYALQLQKRFPDSHETQLMLHGE